MLALQAPARLSSAAELPPEPTREEYVEAAEPICQSNVHANRKIFKGAKGEVKRGELRKAAGHFFRAANAFNRAIRQLKALPRPPADKSKLGKWLGLLGKESTLVRKIGKALNAEKRHRAESLSVELNRNSNRANNSVLSFGFDYCRIESSRFG
jgi:hypothetical protein